MNIMNMSSIKADWYGDALKYEEVGAQFAGLRDTALVVAIPTLFTRGQDCIS